MTDGVAFKLYLQRNGLHPTTVKNYLTAMGAYFAHFDEFDENSVDSFISLKLETISTAGVNKYIKAFKRYIAFKELSGFKSVHKLKERPKSRYTLSDTEIGQIIDCAENKYTVFFALLAYTGARPGEITHLKLVDIDQAQDVLLIHHTKTGEPRKIIVLNSLKTYLYPYIKTLNATYLFSADKRSNQRREGKPIEYNSYMKEWKKRLEIVGITKPVQPYSLRYSFITNTLGNGANLFDIQSMVGHSDSNTTRKYYKGNLELMRKAASKLPLAMSKENPQDLADQFVGLIDEYLGKHVGFDKAKLQVVKQKVYEAVKKNPT